MEIIMIMSGLALLAASVSLILIIRGEKRNEKRRAAMVNYTDQKVSHEMNELSKATRAYIDEKFSTLSGEINQLKQGIVPDFEEAKRAVSSVNDFNRGLNAILGFDPFAAMEKQREKELYGERG